MKKIKKEKKSIKKILLVVALVMTSSLFILVILEKNQVINLYTTKNNISTDDAKTTSKATTAQADFTQGGERTINTNEKNEGYISDNDGNVSNIPNQDQWLVSPDGNITAYYPAKSSTLISGDSFAGESKLTMVHFRLIDDISGVIAQGSLKVINGKFSGSLNFTTNGTDGRLDIFSSSVDGVESSNIEIPVRFR